MLKGFPLDSGIRGVRAVACLLYISWLTSLICSVMLFRDGVFVIIFGVLSSFSVFIPEGSS